MTYERHRNSGPGPGLQPTWRETWLRLTMWWDSTDEQWNACIEAEWWEDTGMKPVKPGQRAQAETSPCKDVYGHEFARTYFGRGLHPFVKRGSWGEVMAWVNDVFESESGVCKR